MSEELRYGAHTAAELRALCEKAQPYTSAAEDAAPERTDANMAFVWAAHTSLPLVLDHIDALKAVNRKISAVVEAAEAYQAAVQSLNGVQAAEQALFQALEDV